MSREEVTKDCNPSGILRGTTVAGEHTELWMKFRSSPTDLDLATHT